MMAKSVIENDVFYLTVNYSNDPFGFSNAENFTFENFNISEDEGIILTNYFEALALIGIEYLNNKKINEFSYDEKLFYME